MPTVLFLCTGNYYRSRFAEIAFNALAEERGSPWRADSRGLQIDPFNFGPLSRHTARALEMLAIPLPAERYPLALTEVDLTTAAHVVAVKEAEHRELLEASFPDWVERVEFWHIHDLDCAEPKDALPLLHEHVRALFERLVILA